MFGTFQEELPDVPIVYGLVDPVHSLNPIYLQVCSVLFTFIPRLVTQYYALPISENKTNKQTGFLLRQIT